MQPNSTGNHARAGEVAASTRRRPENTGPPPANPSPVNPRQGSVRGPLFGTLWAGQALATISEALFVVILTLLVLDLAGPGPALGLTLAAAALPRALLLLPAGVLVDRSDPAWVALISTWLRTVLLVALVTLVVLGPPPVAVIAVLAALLGALDAAYYPASMAVLPRVVPAAGLARANALLQSAESAGDFFGPLAAAGLVALAGFGGGLGTVTLLYLFAGLALTVFVRRLARATEPVSEPQSDPDAGEPDVGQDESGLRALREGLSFARTDPIIRLVLLVLVALNVSVLGPVLVGGAVLAEQRLGNASSLGWLLSGFGAGSLLGLLAAGARPIARRGLVLVGGSVLIGVGTGTLGIVDNIPTAVAVLAVVGVGSGYLGVALVAWMQEMVPEHLRGRIMSLVVLATIAFDPLSYALAGLLLPAGLTVLFAICGGLVLLCAAAAFAVPTLRGWV